LEETIIKMIVITGQEYYDLRKNFPLISFPFYMALECVG